MKELQRIHRKSYFAWAACLLLLGSATGAWAAKQGPVATTRQFWHEMQRTAQIESALQREAIIAELFSQHFDFDGFYQRALIDHWSKWTPEQRKAFASRFRPRFIGHAARKFGGIMKKLDRTMKHVPSQTDWGYQVRSITYLPKGGTLSVSSYLKKVDNQWKIIDLDIAGALLSRNYRGQFNHILRRYGYKELLARIERKKT